MYLVIGTRPDITFTVSNLSQLNCEPTHTQFTNAKHTLRYLNYTEDWELLYPSDTKLQKEAYSDASYGQSPDDQ
jgi:hypothetical protein